MGEMGLKCFICYAFRSSSNTSLSTVTQNGVAKTRGHVIGETTVTAAMNRAMHNTGTATIRVAPAVTLDIIDDHVREVEVGKKVRSDISRTNLIFCLLVWWWCSRLVRKGCCRYGESFAMHQKNR